MRRFLSIVMMIFVILAVSISLFLARGNGKNTYAEPTKNTYTEEDLMARYTRDRMLYQAIERGEIIIAGSIRSKYFEILKKVLAEYPQSSFAPAWQLAKGVSPQK